jgi:hypothetical protein
MFMYNLQYCDTVFEQDKLFTSPAPIGLRYLHLQQGILFLLYGGFFLPDIGILIIQRFFQIINNLPVNLSKGTGETKDKKCQDNTIFHVKKEVSGTEANITECSYGPFLLLTKCNKL